MQKLKQNFKYSAVITILFSVILMIVATIRWFGDNIFIFPMTVGIILVFFSSKIVSFFSKKIKEYESKYFYKLLKKLEKYILAFIILILSIFSIMFIFGLYNFPNILIPFKKIFITILMGTIIVTIINLVEDIIIHKKKILSNIKENIILLSANLIIIVFMFFSSFNYYININEIQGEFITGIVIFTISIVTLIIKIGDYKKESFFKEKNIDSFKESTRNFLFFTESFFIDNENKKANLLSIYNEIVTIDLILDNSKSKERGLSQKINEFYRLLSDSVDYFNVGKVKIKDSQRKVNVIGSNINMKNRNTIVEKIEDIKSDFRVYIKLYETKEIYTDLELNEKWMDIKEK